MLAETILKLQILHYAKGERSRALVVARRDL